MKPAIAPTVFSNVTGTIYAMLLIQIDLVDTKVVASLIRPCVKKLLASLLNVQIDYFAYPSGMTLFAGNHKLDAAMLVLPYGYLVVWILNEPGPSPCPSDPCRTCTVD